MPELSRSQLLAYAAVVLAVVLLGARALGAEGGAASGDGGGAVVGGGSGADGGGRSGSAPGRTTAGGGAAGVGAGGTGDGPVEVDVADAADAPVLVHVAGVVRRPGVYRLSAGRRVRDAVARAGGRAPGGDVDAINLAAKLADGQRIVVPARAAAPATAGAAGAPAPEAAGGAVAEAPPAAGASDPAAAGPIDLNTATAEQLDTLDGVGPAIAAKILAWREEHGGFRSVDDLAEIPGIGPKRLEALRARVTA